MKEAPPGHDTREGSEAPSHAPTHERITPK